MNRILFAGVAALALTAAANAIPVTIEDGFVKAGVSDTGTLGSNSNAPPGILYDKTGTANYGANDFLTPGTPFEGFYIKADGNNWWANNTGTTAFATAAPVSLTGKSASWSADSIDGAISVANTYTLTTLLGRSVVAIDTSITNLGTSTLTNLEFLRTLDPDPDVNLYGVYNTANAILSGYACGTGNNSGQTICIGTESDRPHKVGISGDWATDPDVYLAGVNTGPYGDYAIGLAFALGDLAAGASTTISYYYALGADRGTASGGSDNPGVPEPLTLAVFGAGLAGLWGARRKKTA